MSVGPTILPLDEAIGEIAQACQYAEIEEKRKRFVFLVGAGLSYPSVPLARDIEAECREIAEKRNVKPLAGDPSAMQRYSYWFGQAYPQRLQRQRYLKKLIEKKAISLANFRLAHLLLAGQIANVVIMPNFDDFLARALNTFGHDTFRVCDHPGTVERISQANQDVQIVQVHGTYWSYDQANLSGELEERSKASSTTTSSMAQLLDSLFKELSPIVVGYSGWEGDVIMRAFQRRLHTSLGYKGYWFCYRRSDIGTLPDWLKDHQDVTFVLPPETSSPERLARARGTESAIGNQADVASELESPVRLKPETIVEADRRVEVLEAHTVFDCLLKELKSDIPPLVRDPLDFFARRLEASVPSENQTSQGAAAYSFGTMIERIRSAQMCLETSQRAGVTTREGKAGALLDEVRDAVRRSLYEGALQAALRIAINGLNETELRRLVESLSIATQNVLAKSEYALPGLDLLIKAASKLSHGSPNPQLDLTIAEALFNKGTALAEQNENREAIAAYDELVDRFEEFPDGAFQSLVAKALLNKGVALGTLNRSEEEIAAYNELVRRFGDHLELGLRDQVANALLNKGITLGTLSLNEEAIAAYDELVRRLGDPPAATLQEPVAKALFNKGIKLGSLNRSEEEIAAYDDLVRRFGDSSELALQHQVSKALFNKAYTLGTLNRGQEEVATYDELVRRFGDSLDPALQDRVAKALFNKGFTLATMARAEEAIAAYDEVARRFGDSPEPMLQVQVAKALGNKGIRLGKMNRSEEAITVCDEVLHRFGNSQDPVLREQVAKALVNKGFRLGTLNRSEEEIAVYDEVVRRFGDSPDAALRNQVARALLNKGVTLGTLSRSEEEINVYDEVVRRSGDNPDPAMQGTVASALLNKGLTLEILNRNDEAAKAFDQVIERFGNSSDPSLLETTKKARRHREKLSGV